MHGQPEILKIKDVCCMAALQTMTIPQFLNGDYNFRKDSESQILNKFIGHLKKHKIAYRIIGTTIFIMLASADIAFAASTGIDVGGRRLYSKLIGLAKWVIIVKGGFDIINNTVKGDFDVAKKSFFQYVMVYVILLGLPWALSEVEVVFSDM